MSKQKKFNLLRFVYGELFLNSLGTSNATLTVKSWQAVSWQNILHWLERNKYITDLSIKYVKPFKRRISYKFNYDNLMYPNYLKYLQKLVDDRTVVIN